MGERCGIACCWSVHPFVRCTASRTPLLCALFSSNGVSWTFTKCDFDDFNGYADKADEVLEARGIRMNNYRYA